MATSHASFKVGVNIFVIREGKLLLGKRQNVFGEGSWGLPGGHLEEGESMLSAAARELHEETGLTATQFVFSNVVNDRRAADHRLQVGFVAEGVTGEPQLLEPDKCSAWEWFDLDTLPDPLFIGHIQQITLFKQGNVPFGEN